ncbi:MAG: glycosyltransferase family 39 protein [bacterium]
MLNFRIRKNLPELIAGLMLFIMFILGATSMAGDSLTMDELSHIPAGYSYITQRDMRINAEHPPLIKDLAGLPLLFIRGINFPTNEDVWVNGLNNQWDYGHVFLFEMNNPASLMIFWSRIPMLFVLMILGIYLFKWTSEIFGKRAGLLALFLYTFSPTFLAHGRLVTTDVGAAAGAFVASYYFVKFLKSNTKKNLIFAGIAFGIAELLKFSLILLLPLFALTATIWVFSKTENWKSFLKTLFSFAVYSIIIVTIGYLLLYPIYLYHVSGYPVERQLSDTELLLASSNLRPLADLVIFMADKPILRPYAQYALGLLMVFQRVSGGNTTYFMGEITSVAWANYFPVVYLIKETIVFHLITLISLIITLIALLKGIVIKSSKNTLRRIKDWVSSHIDEICMATFIVIYWISSLRANLNIGVRHLLPVFPLTFALVAGIFYAKIFNPPNLKIKYGILALLVGWQVVSVLSVYPHFLSYFNEFIGPKNGYQYVADSNLDWGQELKRLNLWLEEQNIKTIYIDYFGGSDVKYYLGDKAQSWWGTRDPNELPRGSYLAVSATFLDGGRGKPIKGYDGDHGFYDWLNQYQPVTVIGNSMFVYYIK